MGVTVALRKESVDRNPAFVDTDAGNLKSLSARRAWIEIGCQNGNQRDCIVALRKESVDRNRKLLYPGSTRKSRSPQGERG